MPLRRNYGNLSFCLIHLDLPVNHAGERKAGNESDRSANESEANGDHGHVCHIDNDGQNSNQIQSARQEPETVEEEVEPCGSAVHKGLPPPAVVFSTELQVAEDDADMGAGGGQDAQDGQEESHDVI
mmetsp:Transcript_9295/g.22559  ORF Transcript_9295/g.22559 Transcript_9295/m.22559 type:complete len:127 (-) Transcript_9295:1597-1977(-)